MIRIAVTGPESSGKTTLAYSLTKELKGLLIPEYARDYLKKRNGRYEQTDLDIIAKNQFANWEHIEKKYLICDTEMLVLKIWSEFKYNVCSPFIIDKLKQQQFDLYFLCRPDIPWEEDFLREHPHERDKLFEIYHKELLAMKVPFTIVEGSHETRIKICMSRINTLIITQ